MTTPDVPPPPRILQKWAVFNCRICKRWLRCPSGPVDSPQRHITLEEATALALAGADREESRPCEYCYTHNPRQCWGRAALPAGTPPE